MSWAKIDDRANENAKQLKAGAKACWLWACGLMYCNRQPRKTGSIPKEVLPLMFPGLGKREAARLVAVGLWHDEGDHYQVHDYHGWNPELGTVRAEAGRKGGKVSGKKRSKATSKSEAKAKQLASENEATIEAVCLPRVQPPAHARTDARGIHPTPPLKLEPPLPPEGGDSVDPVVVVFDAWREETGHRQAKLDRKRRARIQVRLKEGFTPDQLIQAIRNRRQRSWLMGDNPDRKVYDGLSTLLRDAEQVEALLALSDPDAAVSPPDDSADLFTDEDADRIYGTPEAQA